MSTYITPRCFCSHRSPTLFSNRWTESPAYLPSPFLPPRVSDLTSLTLKQSPDDFRPFEPLLQHLASQFIHLTILKEHDRDDGLDSEALSPPAWLALAATLQTRHLAGQIVNLYDFVTSLFDRRRKIKVGRVDWQDENDEDIVWLLVLYATVAGGEPCFPQMRTLRLVRASIRERDWPGAGEEGEGVFEAFRLAKG